MLSEFEKNSANYVIGPWKSYLETLLMISIYDPGIDGQFGLVFGTSASAPVFASMITLINDARLAIGKGPLGFINPLVGRTLSIHTLWWLTLILKLYDPIFAPAFNDITQGGNHGCGMWTFHDEVQSEESWYTTYFNQEPKDLLRNYQLHVNFKGVSWFFNNFAVSRDGTQLPVRDGFNIPW